MKLKRSDSRKAKQVSTNKPQTNGLADLKTPDSRSRSVHRFLLSPALLLVVLLALVSCKSVKSPEFRNVDNIRFAGMGKGSSTVNFNVHYFNPNDMRLKLKKLKGKAWLDNQYIGDFKMDTLVHILPHAEFTLPVSLEIKTDQLIRNSIFTLLNKEVQIKMEGNARVGKGLFFINYPVRYEGKQDLKKYIK